jgi:hypothetical protein
MITKNDVVDLIEGIMDDGEVLTRKLKPPTLP